ncbi:unnamed protein product [Gadus morhua 'NCC']
MQDRESFLPGKAGLHADFRGDNGSKGDTVRWLSQSGVYKMPFNVEVTRDAACQTESSGALQTEENRNPSKRTEAFQVKVREHGVHRIRDELDVVCSKPAKRQRHYDTESYDGSPPRLPLPDDVTDWHANSKSL